MTNNDIDDTPHPATAATPTTEEAAAYVLSAALGRRNLSPAEALAGLRRRVEVLQDPLSPAALAEMRKHLPLLDALFQRFSIEALNTARAEQRTLLLRAALQAQQAYSRTFALLHGLALQAKGQGFVQIHDDDGDGLEAPDDAPDRDAGGNGT